MLRTMMRGQAGPDVLAIQEALKIRTPGLGLVVDGKFGPNTEAAVKDFQRRNGLVADGIVGPRTRSVLYPLVATGVNMVGARTLGVSSRSSLVGAAGGAGSGRASSAGGAGSGRTGITGGAGSRLPPLANPGSTFALGPMQPPGLPQPVQGPVLNPPIGPRLKFDSFQLQPGRQVSFVNLLQDPQPSFSLGLQSVFKRGEDDGRLELALGVQLGSPLFVKASDGSEWSFAWFANFTWVDPLGNLGLFHFWSPFATVGGQATFPGQVSLGAGLFPINLSVDVIPDKLNISVNSGIAGTFGLGDGSFQWSAQTTFGCGATFTLF